MEICVTCKKPFTNPPDQWSNTCEECFLSLLTIPKWQAAAQDVAMNALPAYCPECDEPTYDLCTYATAWEMVEAAVRALGGRNTYRQSANGQIVENN